MRELTPRDLNLPEKFDRFRPGQLQAIEDGVMCTKRFSGQSLPTGSGKTLTYIAQAQSTGKRVRITTATLGLQDQIMEDFSKDRSGGGTLNIACVKGRARYTCTARPGWTCEDGYNGGCSARGTVKCEHSRTIFKAMVAPIVVTNYSCLMMANKYGTGWGVFDWELMDEAHAAFNELSNAVQIKVSSHEIEEMLEQPFPVMVDDMSTWKTWASLMRPIAEVKLKEMMGKVATSKVVKNQWVRDLSHLKNLYRKLGSLATVKAQDWVADNWEFGFQFDPIRPSRWAESMLYAGAPRVSFFSATIRTKSLNMVGVWEDFDFFDYPSTFPTVGNLINCVPTAYMNHNATEHDVSMWLLRADQILSMMGDRRGTFHTKSFPRRDLFYSKTDYKKWVITNRQGDVTSEVVERFRKLPPPILLLSPSISTGYDLKDEECRYQIIGKVPWPDSRSKIMKAREQYDKMYAPYVTAQEMMQMTGRARRSESDWCQNYVIDNSINPFIRNYHWMFPRWWLEQLRFPEVIPPPLPLDWRVTDGV